MESARDPQAVDEGSKPALDSPRESARALVTRLLALHAGEASLDERLGALREASAQCPPILARLASHYEGSPQPMPASAREALAAAHALHFALATGYRDAALSRIAAPPGMPHKLAPLLFQAMRWIAAAMHASYNSYAQLPAGCWKELHGLYLMAEREGVASGIADAASRESLLDLYGECLLISLTDPYRLQPGEVDAIAKLARAWRGPVMVSREPPETRPTGHFLVECEDDRPPRPFRDGERIASASSRILDTGALVDRLRSAKQAASDEERWLIAKVDALWNDPPKRAFVRESADGSVAICAGVKAIAFFVAHEVAVDGESEAKALRQGLTMPLQALPEDEAGRLIPIHEWSVVNVSTGGLRARRSASTDDPVVIGEVVGLREPGKAMWRIGVARWVTGLADGATDFGVQFFANAVCAVWVRAFAPGGERKLALLVVKDDAGSEELLLTPPGNYTAGTQYELRGEGFRSRVSAAALVEGNSRFELFHVVAC
jgi:hypothetical protein